MSSGALERIAARGAAAPARAGPRCDLCGLALPEQHRHLLDEERDEPMCVCQACRLLFEREAAARGHFRLVPDTRIRLPDLTTEGLGVPVGLVFVVRGRDGTVVAHYPSPIGTTEHEIDPENWAAVERACPELAGMAPAVQALLINTARGNTEHWLVPIDECYRLVALIRGEWQGLSGGTRVWPEVDRFFAGLAGPRRGAH
jgi:hypothetical protein